MRPRPCAARWRRWWNGARSKPSWSACKEWIGPPQREDLLRYQIAEIEEAQLEEGEEEHLNAERLRLAHAERIAAGVMGAYEALYGSQHGETPGAHGALSTALERLQEAVSFDEGLQDAVDGGRRGVGRSARRGPGSAPLRRRRRGRSWAS